MKDIIAMCSEIQKRTGGNKLMYQQQVFQELSNALAEEIKKGTDLSPYLSVSFNVLQNKYEIKLELSPSASFFDSGSGDGKR